MKGSISKLSLGACLLVLAGCGHDATHQAQSAPEPDRSAPGSSLQLDNGKKWRVDSHTRGSAGEMLALVRNAAPVGSQDEAVALADAIDAELKNLIAGCTMKGPAHDQLHVFLVALFPKVEALKKKIDPGELRTVQQEIVALFDSYERHFE